MNSTNPIDLDSAAWAPWVSAGAPAWPDRATARWLVHHRLRHKDQLWWRKLRLHWLMLRRGCSMRYALQGNALQMLKQGRLQVGRGCIFDGQVTVRGNEGARILLGAGVGMNRNVTVGAHELVVIGDHTIIGQGCYITDADHVVSDPDKPSLDQGMRVKGPTVIEDHVWLGVNVFVGSGVRIGRGSMVGANSVVTKDVPPYSIVYGVAATARPRPDLGDRAAAAAAAPATVTAAPTSPAPQDRVPLPR